MSENFRLLLVEDNSGNVRLIQKYLKDVPLMNVELCVVDTLEKALKMLEEDNIDLVLLDLGLPDSTGLETVDAVIAHAPSVPVVVLTGISDNRRAMEAINIGAQDYLVRDLINTNVLVRSIRYSIYRKQTRVEIEQSEKMYRSIWVNSMDGLAYLEVVTDDDGKPIDSIFMNVNASFEKITGLQRNDVIGKRLSEVKPQILSDDLDFSTTFSRVALTGEPVRFEVQKPEGERWFSVSVYSPSQGTFVCVLQDITEKKKAEAQLLEERNRAQSYLDIAGVLLIALDDSSNIIMMNQMACEILCCLPEDYIGKNWVDSFILEKDRDEVSNVLATLMRGEIKSVEYFENEVVTHDGKERTIAWNNTLLKDADGCIISTLSSGEDITERKQAEKALRESEQRNRTIVDAMSDLVFVHDIEGRYRDCFSQDDSLLTRPWDEVKGRRIEEILPQELAAQYLKNMKKVRETGKSTSFEYELETGGASTWFQGTFLLHEDGESTVVVIKEITDRKQAEISLSESEDRYRLLVENTHDGVYIRDNNVFLDMNQPLAEMLGEDQSELIGTPVMDFWTPDSQERIKEYIRDGLTYAIELELLRRDGSTRLVEAFGKNCQYNGKNARIVAIKDISKQKKAQQETRQAADIALLYLDIMSHDVRNQLQAVVMASEIIQHVELNVESVLALEIITESVVKSQKLINKVLHTRELLSVPLSDFSLKTALENSLKSLNQFFDEIEIEAKYLSIDPRVNADKFLEQLLMNILENAVEYNERKERKLWIDIQESGQGYQVSIKDNGQGINDEKKESLFDPSRRFGGIGIHQTIRILQKYGGHISVHDRVASEPTQGAEFRLWFPKAKSSS